MHSANYAVGDYATLSIRASVHLDRLSCSYPEIASRLCTVLDVRKARLG